MTALARELGLSRNTLSAVINNRASALGISERTAERVREHMERRGYVPSRQAQQLRAAPGRVTGLLHMGRVYGHMVEASHRLVENLSQLSMGFEVIVATSTDRIKAAVRELLARRVTDLVWIHATQLSEEFRDPGLAGYLSRLRLIIYNYRFDFPLGDAELLERRIHLVGVDRTAQKKRLARFLYRQGHRTVAFPDVGNAPFPAGHAEFFVQEGLKAADYSPPFSVPKMLDAMRHQGVTAACFNGDTFACQAIEDLEKHGVRIPEDLTVTGFDGTSMAFNRKLTTLVMPVADMVARTCAIVTGEEDGLRHCFDMELAKGGSHGPPRCRGRIGAVAENGKGRRYHDR